MARPSVSLEVATRIYEALGLAILMLLMFKSLNGPAPSYLQNLFTPCHTVQFRKLISTFLFQNHALILQAKFLL